MGAWGGGGQLLTREQFVLQINKIKKWGGGGGGGGGGPGHPPGSASVRLHGVTEVRSYSPGM